MPERSARILTERGYHKHRPLLENLEPRLLMAAQPAAGQLLADGASIAPAAHAAVVTPILSMPSLASGLSERRAAMTTLPATALWDLPLANGTYRLSLAGIASAAFSADTVAATTPSPVSWQATIAVTDGHLLINNQSTLTLRVTSMSVTPVLAAAPAATSATVPLTAPSPAPPVPKRQDPTPTPAPSGTLSATAAGAHEIDLTWTAQSGAAGYSIERSTDGQTYAVVAQAAAGTTTYADANLTPGTSYWYRVHTISADKSMSTEALATSGKTDAFVAYNLLQMKNLPNMAGFGFSSADLNYGGRAPVLVNGTWTKVLDEAATRKMARDAAAVSNVLIIDIEDWPTDIRTNSQATVNQSISNFSQMIDWIRNERPQLKIGIYGVMPVRDYWTPVAYQQWLDTGESAWAKNNPAAYQQGLSDAKAKMDAWEAANAALRPLAAKVDTIYASLYTFYDDPQDWQAYAKWNLEQAAQFGKPVVAFLWNEYHLSNEVLKGQDIPAADFRAELEYVYQHADGVAVWNEEPTTMFDATSGWEQQLLDFMATHHAQIAP